MEDIKVGATDLWESLRALSTLGRVQSLLILGNSLLTLVLLNVAASYSADADHHVDGITLVISLIFALGSILGLLYTIRVESPYAFVALVILQLEQVAFVTAASAGNILTSAWAKWLVVSTNFASMLLFLGLQLFVRQSWGWHAYKAIGGSAESIQLYLRYQKLAGIMYLDLIHTIFFIVAEEVVVHTDNRSLVLGATIPCLFLGFVLLGSVRRDLRILSLMIYLVYIFSFIVFVYYTLINTVGTMTDDLSNLAHHQDFTAHDQAVIVTVIEWCVLVARFVFLVVSFRVITTKGFKQLLANSNHEGRYLISAEEIDATSSYRDHINSSAPHHPRQIAIIDSSHQSGIDLRQP